MPPELLRSGTIFRHASPYAVSSYVRQHVGTHAITVGRDSGRATLAHKKFGQLGLSQLSYGTEVTVSTPTGLESMYHLQLVIAGCCMVRYAAREAFALTPGTATLINPDEPVALEYSADCVKLIVNVPQTLMTLRRDQGSEAGQLCFRPTALDLPRDGALYRMLELMFLEADQQPAEKLSLSGPIGQLVAAKLLEQFPHDCVALREDARFFAQVDGFISAHIRTDFSAADLARATNVSLRTLYERFKQSGRPSPHTYIKQCRLRCVRERIEAGLPRARNVTEVALEHGVSHLGRFSADYKQLFGELPSDTLRRRIHGN